MKNVFKVSIFCLFLFFLILIFCFSFSRPSLSQPWEKEMSEQIRKPAVAGMFYPSGAEKLSSQINDYLNKVPPLHIEEKIVAIISPHAGYEFSGGVAAYSFKAIEQRDFSTVVIIGPSHYVYFKGISVYAEGYYQTPLGNVEIDRELSKAIINNSNIHFYPSAHQREHSIEVEIPFLQTVLKNFKIVPIIMGDCSYQDCLDLGEAIAENSKDKKTLIVASTDFSHFYPSEKARILDKTSLDEIKKFNPQELYKKVQTEECQLCGAMPVVTTLIAAQTLGADKIELLKYLHSGDVTGDNSRVVGYGSMIVIGSKPQVAGYRQEIKKDKKGKLSNEEKKRLLSIAREAIGSYVIKRKKPEMHETNPELIKKRGVFVTLTQNGQLRGCIGYIQAVKPLCEAVTDMAIEAAVNDPRFSPLQKEELSKIKIEISVLSPLKRIKDTQEIKIGRDGIFIRKGFDSGLLLPQVATENNWNKDEFLKQGCYKAGLPADAWKKGAEIYTFSAEIFDESLITLIEKPH